jgi:stage II sporulation protein D
MKILFFFTALAATLCTDLAFSVGADDHLDVSVQTKPATMRILIAKERKGVLLEAKGSYRVFDPTNHLQLASGATAKKALVFYQPDGMAWGTRIADVASIRIVPQDANSTILVDGIEYRGCVEIHAVKEGLLAINEVDIERYLKSTLTFSFAEEMDSEVLEAVAIAERTHAYYLAKTTSEALWHVEAADVAYEGSALSLQNPAMHQAIGQTRHMVLTFEGAYFPAVWSKDSAGKTAEFAQIFRKKVKMPHAVSTTFAAKERDKHMWFLEISKRDLAQKLVSYSGLQKITDIGLFLDKDSQKVYALRVSQGQTHSNIDFFSLQKALGETALKSNDFIVEIKGDKIYFTGYGEGHGVGMCLLSASYYADKGEKAKEILGHFFPRAELTHMSK